MVTDRRMLMLQQLTAPLELLVIYRSGTSKTIPKIGLGIPAGFLVPRLGRSKRKDPRQTIVSVPSIRLMPGWASCGLDVLVLGKRCQK